MTVFVPAIYCQIKKSFVPSAFDHCQNIRQKQLRPPFEHLNIACVLPLSQAGGLPVYYASVISSLWQSERMNSFWRHQNHIAAPAIAIVAGSTQINRFTTITAFLYCVLNLFGSAFTILEKTVYINGCAYIRCLYYQQSDSLHPFLY